MVETKSKNRKRRNPGALSVLNELDDSYESTLVFEPNVDDATLREIKIQSEIADAPTWERHKLEEVVTSNTPSPTPVAPSLAPQSTEELQINYRTTDKLQKYSVSSSMEEAIKTNYRQTTDNLRGKNKTIEKLQENSRSTNLDNYRNTTDKVHTNYIETTETNYRKSTGKLQENSRKSADVETITTGKSTDDTTAKLQINYRPSTDVTYRQTTDRPITKDLSLLTGHQKMAFTFLFFQAREFGSQTEEGHRLTPRLAAEQLCIEARQTNVRSTREVVRELLKAGLIYKSFSKHGRGGWTQYLLPKEIYTQAMLAQYSSESHAKLQTNYRKTTDETAGQTAETPPSSSSLNLNTTTTGKMPQEWEAIEIPDGLITIGLGRRHLEQLCAKGEGAFTVDQVQESLNSFAYDLENGLIKARTGPLNFLLGVMVKNGNPYISEAFLEEQKRQIEAYSKKVGELQATKAELTEALRQEQFEKWLQNLSQEEKNRLVPPSGLVKEGNRYQDLMLKEYWAKNVETRTWEGQGATVI